MAAEQNPELIDVYSPISILLENRPYTCSPDGRIRIFCFRKSEIVSVLILTQDNLVKNTITTFGELANIGSAKIVRLPGVLHSRFNDYHLDFTTISDRIEQGWILKKRRSKIELPDLTTSGELSEWLDQIEVPVLTEDYVRLRIKQHHNFNLKDERNIKYPKLGVHISDKEQTTTIREVYNLKKDVDLDLSDTQRIFQLGLCSMLGEKTDIAAWFKQSFSSVLIPEILNLGRYNNNKLENRLKNVIMQLDRLIRDKFRENNNINFSGLNFGISLYIPDARVIVNLALGDYCISSFSDEKKLLTYTQSPQLRDIGEQARILKNGLSVDLQAKPIVISGTKIPASRALGLYEYKKSGSKPYSRALGTISSCPEISIQKLSSNQKVWLLICRTSELHNTDSSALAELNRIGNCLEENYSSQFNCNRIVDQFNLSTAFLSRIDQDVAK